MEINNILPVFPCMVSQPWWDNIAVQTYQRLPEKKISLHSHCAIFRRPKWLSASKSLSTSVLRKQITPGGLEISDDKSPARNIGKHHLTCSHTLARVMTSQRDLGHALGAWELSRSIFWAVLFCWSCPGLLSRPYQIIQISISELGFPHNQIEFFPAISTFSNVIWVRFCLFGCHPPDSTPPISFLELLDNQIYIFVLPQFSGHCQPEFSQLSRWILGYLEFSAGLCFKSSFQLFGGLLHYILWLSFRFEIFGYKNIGVDNLRPKNP